MHTGRLNNSSESEGDGIKLHIHLGGLRVHLWVHLSEKHRICVTEQERRNRNIKPTRERKAFITNSTSWNRQKKGALTIKGGVSIMQGFALLRGREVKIPCTAKVSLMTTLAPSCSVSLPASRSCRQKNGGLRSAPPGLGPVGHLAIQGSCARADFSYRGGAHIRGVSHTTFIRSGPRQP